MDENGITPESLRDCIENWKEKTKAQERDSLEPLKPPKALYTVPTGQNPTGVVTSMKRKKEIYKVRRTEN